VSGSVSKAVLIEDRGEAAVSDDFFRSRPFLDAEGATHTLRIEADGEELLAPLVVRAIGDGPELDAVSPYGYPGLAHSGRSSSRYAEGTSTSSGLVDPAAVDFSATGLVSAFIRHTLADPPPLEGASERNIVQVADPELPPKSRMSDRQQIRKNLRRGYEMRLVPGPETNADERAGFLEAYEQTMRRAGAGERYFFSAAYFDRVLEADSTWLALALAPEGTVAAASIAARSDGYLHYYLSGSVDSQLRDSPMKNVVASLVEHSTELGLPLNLGGGLSRGDRLEEFKRGFANREQPWRTSELVCDPPSYTRLSSGHGAGDFFPAYRAPGA
jgi:Acetyltransferase (GNAT) domain